MADAAVEFLLENLKQLLLYHGDLIVNSKEYVEQLENDLRLFNAFLKQFSKKRNRDDILKEVVREIRNIVYEAEDTIDRYVTQAAESRTERYFGRLRRAPKLIDITKAVQRIQEKVTHIYETRQILLATLQTADEAEVDIDDRKAPLVRQENVVGFEDEAATVINFLITASDELDVISIIGMPGLGKTTLAGKIFRDSKIEFEFPTRIWVFVSQDYRRKDVFLSILSKFITLTDEMRNDTIENLVIQLHRHLNNGKYLIVMDDVWTKQAWDDLQIAFPECNKQGKILITSRLEEVARHANRTREPHRLRFLHLNESKTLLKLEVFGKQECPSGFEDHVTTIARQCNGLPLAIVVIGGILLKKVSSPDWWRRVSESVMQYLHLDQEKRMEKIISLSYNKLPYHLKTCFLYFGMFPEDFEIPVWKLIHLWVAEGFIQQKLGMTLEEIAEQYLDDLISRNLVMAGAITPNGKVKTCRIHDMLRDFCKNEAGKEEENFFHEVRKSSEGAFTPSAADLEKCRRLCIHSFVSSFLSTEPYGPRVRSLLFSSEEEIALQAEHISFIPAAFKLLRVMDIKPIRFNRFPKDLTQLVHLRYIVLSSNFKVLPPPIAKLWNLQTLILYTTERTIEIKADIWKLIQLRHVKSNAASILPKTGKSKGGEKLQTLSVISPQSCTDDVFATAHNLKKLGIRGRLASLLESWSGGSSPFDSLGKLGNLEKLKLLNDVFPAAPNECPLPSLPQGYKFPPKLRSLTLSDTYLQWRHMSTLGMLDTLVVLKLKDNSFLGNIWEPVDGGFRHLEVLQIGKTDLVCWRAAAHHFPSLRCLMLKYCERLGEIPAGLADVSSLHIMDLHRTTKSAADSARSIKKIKLEKQAQQGTTNIEFKLSIYPPNL